MFDGMNFGTIVWLLIIIGVALYRMAKKGTDKQRPASTDAPGRKDGDFSLEEILRKIEEAQKTAHGREAMPKVNPVPVQEDKLPFEKRKPLEKTLERIAKSKEIQRPVVDYDVRSIERLEQAKEKSLEKHREKSNIHFHFSENEATPEIRQWLDMRKAVITAEILRRPEY